MQVIASMVPTTLNELSELGVLGENVMKEYGERLIKNITSFVSQNELQEYIDKRRVKRLKTLVADTSHDSTKETTSPSIIQDDDDFEAPDIDFNSIVMPPCTTTPEKSKGGNDTKSSYFS